FWAETGMTRLPTPAPATPAKSPKARRRLRAIVMTVAALWQPFRRPTTTLWGKPNARISALSQDEQNDPSARCAHRGKSTAAPRKNSTTERDQAPGWRQRARRDPC